MAACHLGPLASASGPGLAVEGPVAAPRMLRGPDALTVRAKGEYARATTCRCGEVPPSQRAS